MSLVADSLFAVLLVTFRRDYFVEILGDVLASSKFAAHEFNEEVLPAIRGEYEQVSSIPQVFVSTTMQFHSLAPPVRV